MPTPYLDAADLEEGDSIIELLEAAASHLDQLEDSALELDDDQTMHLLAAKAGVGSAYARLAGFGLDLEANRKALNN